MADEIEFWLTNELACFQHITVESINTALIGFPLGSKFSDRWMTAQIRKAYFSSVGDGIEDYPGRASVRSELGKIVASLDIVIEQLSTRSGWAESILRHYAPSKEYEETPDPSSSYNIKDYSRDLSDAEKRDPLYCWELSRGEWWAEGGVRLARISPGWQAFREVLMGIRNARTYINDANAALCSGVDPPRWRDHERRKARIYFAVKLSDVFEMAFDKEPTVNNWAKENGAGVLGHWADFFQRVGSVALKLKRIPDLQRTLKEARRSYKRKREDILTRYFEVEDDP